MDKIRVGDYITTTAGNGLGIVIELRIDEYSNEIYHTCILEYDTGRRAQRERRDIPSNKVRKLPALLKILMGLETETGT